ncbi:MAG: GNAT family N-acetyltransferase [Chthoniobacterales bacterium]
MSGRGYEVVERVPDVANYNRVRGAAGLSVKDGEAARIGLTNTLFGVCVLHENEIIGIGRVIGDGGLFYDIVDFAIVPEHQRKGVGRLILSALLAYLDEHARPSALISLMANKGVAPFYAKFGFVARDPDMAAMIIRK